MSQVPIEVVRATLAEPCQIPAAQAVARRKGLELIFDEASLVLWLALDGPATSATEAREPYLIRGELTDYDFMPPIWTFVHPTSRANIGKSAYPKPIRSSVLHGNGLVCAPWNRLAYQVNGGPHGDWGELSGWKMAALQHTYATTIPDMVERLVREVRTSRGRMAPLKPSPAGTLQ